ncbi:MAG: flexitail domain-containing putative surface protein [Dehalococcoidia bacterium]
MVPRWLIAVVGLTVFGSLLLFGEAKPTQAAIDTSASAFQLAQAIAADPTVVTGATFSAVPPIGTPNGVSDTPLTLFPTHGSTYAILTSGDAQLAATANTSGSSGADDGGGNVRGNTDYDVSILKVDLSVPAGINCLVGIDFRFLSDEYPEWLGSSYNDAFIAELDSSTWTTSGSSISAPNNFAFDPTGSVISINAAGVTSMTAENAAGTTYDGATPALTAATPITPGEHSLYFSIFDQGDAIYDSAVFIDNLRLGTVGNVATDCVPGAVVIPGSLVGHWKFNEGAGSTAADSSGNGNDGTLVNGPTWVSGVAGYALEFDGFDDFVQVPDAASLDIAGPFTLMAWVNPDSDVGCYESFINKYLNYALQTCYLNRLRMISSGVGDIESPDNTLVPNVWQHVAGTWDGTSMRLYRNGVEVASTNVGTATPAVSDNALMIGMEDLFGGWEFFGGSIDEVKIFDGALDAAEIASAGISHDTDGDGCTDGQESGPNEQLGGLRDAKNPWDFYDTNGDRVIDLQNDVLQIILRFQTTDGGPPNPDTGFSYAANYDRGMAILTPPWIYPWNRNGPDGVITLQDDILGVIRQYQHSCL